MEQNLFQTHVDWENEWQDMPEFIMHDVKPCDSINVQFATPDEKKEFLKLIGYDEDRKKSIWFPYVDYVKQSTGNYSSVPPQKYPVYVISKGRWETRLTANSLEQLSIPFRIVVEPQERDRYADFIDPEKILVLPFSNLGQGSIPARNWVWEHAISEGHLRHWIMDDNIDGFYRLNKNLKVKVRDFNPFLHIESFADRYSNLPIAGMNYEFFADRRAKQPAVVFNTRIYSCILIENAWPQRWRGRYNEDTDLSIRALKEGLCTALFNSVLIKKMPTMTMVGGNSDELYKDDGRMKMAQSLQEQHPDIVTITEKWGRPQHHVDYRKFKMNLLKRK